ncbi:MAG: hypothetical protein MJH10_13165 [Epibacterium sp.]|nr:hypothetical protein [Epibacterium sp.]NQX74490.1 hypothetical protein [Epibacterium sp.]
MNSGTITNTGDVTLGALGSTAQEYALTLNVTGSKSVTTGAINTKDQAITVNANSLTGKADIGAINAITGNVAIDVDTTGAVDVHAITGKDISLDLSGALGAVSYAGAITATGNVTTVGSNLKANDLDTNDIVLAGTSQTVSVIGSILNDDVDVTSG